MPKQQRTKRSSSNKTYDARFVPVAKRTRAQKKENAAASEKQVLSVTLDVLPDAGGSANSRDHTENTAKMNRNTTTVVETKAKEEEKTGSHPKVKIGDLLYHGKLQSKSAEEVNQDLMAMNNLLEDVGMEEFEDFMKMGGLSVLLSVWHTWESDHELDFVQPILACLAKLSKYEVDRHAIASEESVSWESGLITQALEVTVGGMMMFPDDEYVQLNAMAIVGNVCQYREAEEFAECFVNRWVGLSLVWKAMKDYPDNEGMQDYACWLLGVLCRQKMEEHIVQGGSDAKALIALAIHNFRANEGISESAITVLSKFLKVHPEV